MVPGIAPRHPAPEIAVRNPGGYGAQACCGGEPSDTAAYAIVNGRVLLTLGCLFPMRRVNDSLALVTTDGIAGVTASLGNRFGGNTDDTGQLPAKIGLSSGLNHNAGLRRITRGDDTVTYQLYRDAMRTQEWGNTDGTMSTGTTDNAGSAVNLAVYGKVSVRPVQRHGDGGAVLLTGAKISAGRPFPQAAPASVKACTARRSWR